MSEKIQPSLSDINRLPKNTTLSASDLKIFLHYIGKDSGNCDPPYRVVDLSTSLRHAHDYSQPHYVSPESYPSFIKKAMYQRESFRISGEAERDNKIATEIEDGIKQLGPVLTEIGKDGLETLFTGKPTATGTLIKIGAEAASHTPNDSWFHQVGKSYQQFDQSNASFQHALFTSGIALVKTGPVAAAQGTYLLAMNSLLGISNGICGLVFGTYYYFRDKLSEYNPPDLAGSQHTSYDFDAWTAQPNDPGIISTSTIDTTESVAGSMSIIDIAKYFSQLDPSDFAVQADWSDISSEIDRYLSDDSHTDPNTSQNTNDDNITVEMDDSEGQMAPEGWEQADYAQIQAVLAAQKDGDASAAAEQANQQYQEYNSSMVSAGNSAYM